MSGKYREKFVEMIVELIGRYLENDKPKVWRFEGNFVPIREFANLMESLAQLEYGIDEVRVIE